MRVRNLLHLSDKTLLIGTLFASLLALIGGIYLVAHYASTPISSWLNTPLLYQFSWQKIGYAFKEYKALLIIEIGLFCLVLTQVIRVLILVGYYLDEKDYWFAGFGGFVFIVLLYSLLKPH